MNFACGACTGIWVLLSTLALLVFCTYCLCTGCNVQRTGCKSKIAGAYSCKNDMVDRVSRSKNLRLNLSYIQKKLACNLRIVLKRRPLRLSVHRPWKHGGLRSRVLSMRARVAHRAWSYWAHRPRVHTHKREHGRTSSANTLLEHRSPHSFLCDPSVHW